MPAPDPASRQLVGEEASDTRGRPWSASLVVAVAVLLALVAIVYAPVMTHGAFIWDDHALVERNPLVTRGSVAEIVRRPFLPAESPGEARAVYYRPLTVLSLRADFGLAAEDATSYHVSNILLHLTAVIAFVAAARRLGASRWASACAAALWALHPRSTEAVAWISGRTDVIATLFALVALALWPWYGAPAVRAPRIRAALTATAVLFGLLAKESAGAVLIAIVVGTWVSAGGATWRLRTATTIARVAWLLPAALIYGSLRLGATRQLVSTLTPLGAQGRALTALEALGRYLAMTVDPWHPATSMGLVGEPDLAAVAAGLLVLCLLGGFATVRVCRARQHARTAPASDGSLAAALALAASSLALVAHLVPIALSAGVTCDRLLYLPLAGGLLAAALAAGRLPLRSQRIAAASALVLAASFIPVVRGRALDYTDELRFRVVATEHAHARNTSARSGLANVLRAYGAPELACRMHASVLRLLERGGRTGTTRYAHALENLGACYEVTGEYGAAVLLYERLLAFRPASAGAHVRLGYVRLHMFELDAAEAEFTRAVAIDPKLALARQMLAELPALRARRARFSGSDQRRADPVGWAMLVTRLGRLPDAVVAWLPLVEDPRTSNDDAWRGMDFLLANADYPTARRATEAYQQRAAIDVPLANQLLAGRRAQQASVEALRMRIEHLIVD